MARVEVIGKIEVDRIGPGSLDVVGLDDQEGVFDAGAEVFRVLRQRRGERIPIDQIFAVPAAGRVGVEGEKVMSSARAPSGFSASLRFHVTSRSGALYRSRAA